MKRVRRSPIPDSQRSIFNLLSAHPEAVLNFVKSNLVNYKILNNIENVKFTHNKHEIRVHCLVISCPTYVQYGFYVSNIREIAFIKGTVQEK